MKFTVDTRNRDFVNSLTDQTFAVIPALTLGDKFPVAFEFGKDGAIDDSIGALDTVEVALSSCVTPDRGPFRIFPPGGPITGDPVTLPATASAKALASAIAAAWDGVSLSDLCVTGANGFFRVEFQGNLADTEIDAMTGDGTKLSPRSVVSVSQKEAGGGGQNAVQIISLDSVPLAYADDLTFDDGGFSGILNVDTVAANEAMREAGKGRVSRLLSVRVTDDEGNRTTYAKRPVIVDCTGIPMGPFSSDVIPQFLTLGQGDNRYDRTVVDVRRFGAVGDGVHDDAPAIQAAIDFCEAIGGGTVWLPEGAYNISSSTILMAENVRLSGNGAQSILYANRTPRQNALVCNKGFNTASGYDGASNWSISYLAIDTNTNGIVPTHCKNIHIHHIWGIETGYHYVDTTCRDSFFDHLFLTGPAGTSTFQIDSVATGQNCFINGSTVSPNRDGTMSQFLYLSDSVITSVVGATSGDQATCIHFHAEEGGNNFYFDRLVLGGARSAFRGDSGRPYRHIYASDIVFDGSTLANSEAIWFPGEGGVENAEIHFRDSEFTYRRRGALFDSTRGIYLTNVTIKPHPGSSNGSDARSFGLSRCSKVRIRDCDIPATAAAGDAFRFNASQDIIISDTDMRVTTESGWPGAVELISMRDDNDSGVLRGLTVEGKGSKIGGLTSGGGGVYFSGAIHFHEIRIRDVDFDGVTESAVNFDNPTEIEDVIIEGCLFRDFRRCVRFHDLSGGNTGRNVRVLNCDFRDPQISSSIAYAVFVGQGWDDVTIEGNDGETFVSSARGGIWFRDTAATGIVRGNNIRALGDGPKIRVDNSPNVVIQGNPGFRTEAKGAAEITSGNTTVAVLHNLDYGPDAEDFIVQAKGGLGSAASFDWAVNGANLEITLNADPTQTVSFVWRASRNP